MNATKLITVAVSAAALVALALGWPESLSDSPLAGSQSTWVPWLSTLVAGLLVLRILLWAGYRPVAPIDDDTELPTLTVVIPAFNEGPGVRRSIESVLASDYPADKLRVIVVNDGSSDDTGVHIDAAAAASSGRALAIHLPTNAGKRHAVFRGLDQATSALVATVDSDSTVPPESLRALVAPIVRQPGTSAVAGKVLVANRRASLISRMLGVRYILGFDFIRAYQSQLRTVWCCPGALQCYRRETIAPHLRRWRDQRFLGAACTNGDDHAMTNLVLSLGHDSRYQSSAEVHTLVPTRYKKLCRMYTRWGRSATREGLRALRFTPRRTAALGPVLGPLMALDALMQPLTVFARGVGFFLGLWLVATAPLTFVLLALGTTIVAWIYALLYLRSDWSSEMLYGVLYAWFALFALPWVQPWATLTVRSNRWMTRG